MQRKPGETPEQLRQRIHEIYPDLTEVETEVMLVGLIGTRIDQHGRILGPKLSHHYDEDAEVDKGIKVP